MAPAPLLVVVTGSGGLMTAGEDFLTATLIVTMLIVLGVDS